MRHWLAAALAAITWYGAASGQEPRGVGSLPDTLAQRIIAFYNAPGTIRLSGETRIAAGTEITGAVAVLGGPVTVAGRITGSLVVINGDLRIDPDARITGSATIVGGGFNGPAGRVDGGVVHFSDPLRFRHETGGSLQLDPGDPELSAGRDFGFGRTDLVVAVRGSYNRVEGLPVAVGPRLRLGRSNPTVLEALGIYRSSAGLRLDPDRMGYVLRLEQFLGGGQTARIGVRVASEIVPIESTGLADRENSLSTFVLHQDHRDAYEREGWVGYVRFARPGWPHDFTIEYRDERYRSAPPASPWSLFDNEEPWRPQPLIAEGTLRSVVGRFAYDSRNDDVEPTTGWLVRAEVEQGLGGRLVQPITVQLPGEEPIQMMAAGARERFTAAKLDVRAYLRLAPTAWATARVFGAGSVDGTALPPQRQRTLGGEGSLPGYGLHAFDCGARIATVPHGEHAFFPFYGCDRSVLFQLEYQAALPWQPSLGGDLRDLGLDQTLRGVMFLDMGRAWNEENALNGRLGGRSSFVADIGFGVRLGSIGLYWAVPLSSGGGTNFFMRLGRRF